MRNKRNPGKNGSLQRNMEKAERWEWKAYNRAWDSKKKRIRKKAFKAFRKVRDVRQAYINHCFDEVLQ